MSDSPLVVSGQALNKNSIAGTVKSPIVAPSRASSSNIINAGVGIKSSVYKVQMIANGKTYNMLLPPSIESKHPGRSNPVQLPGLHVKAGIAISKLKIPGFFPIYQHLGVESLTISMSGMFTAYDGFDILSNAGTWEGWTESADVILKDGQDSYASACEFYDFAVKNKALIEVLINTSDGSFTPKNSESTVFRDTKSNIKFKGYVKEFELVYVRQDRNYYMIKFEIIDLGTNVCKKDKPITPTITTKENPCKGDALVLEYNKLKNKELFKNLLKQRGFLVGIINPTEVQVGEALIRANNYYKSSNLRDLYDKLNADVSSTNTSFTPSTNFSTSVNNIINPPIVTNTKDFSIVNDNLGNSPAGLNISKILTKNNGVIKSIELQPYVTNSSLSNEYKFDNKVDIPQPAGTYPPTRAYLTFTTKTGSLLYLVPNDTTNTSFTLKRRVNNEFI